jgi:hypothetical protein
MHGQSLKNKICSKGVGRCTIIIIIIFLSSFASNLAEDPSTACQPSLSQIDMCNKVSQLQSIAQLITQLLHTRQLKSSTQ